MRIRKYNGPDGVQLFSAGKLAEALGISTQALTAHLKFGTIPKTRYVAPRERNSPMALYSDAQIADVIAVYDEVGKDRVFKVPLEATGAAILRRWEQSGATGPDVMIGA